ncbi:MAG: doc [Phycisphaerales bacterium]|nr:doc [Phycisphaerales bacterium]
MNDPFFLTLDDVLQFHADQIELFGGDPSLLDLAKLESALGQPRATWDGNYLHEDIAAMAAAYLFHIVQNHPFADGNKRTGLNAAINFLALNGFDLNLPIDETEQLVLRVAQGQAQKPEIADFFRRMISDYSS